MMGGNIRGNVTSGIATRSEACHDGGGGDAILDGGADLACKSWTLFEFLTEFLGLHIQISKLATLAHSTGLQGLIASTNPLSLAKYLEAISTTYTCIVIPSAATTRISMLIFQGSMSTSWLDLSGTRTPLVTYIVSNT